MIDLRQSLRFNCNSVATLYFLIQLFFHKTCENEKSNVTVGRLFEWCTCFDLKQLTLVHLWRKSAKLKCLVEWNPSPLSHHRCTDSWWWHAGNLFLLLPRKKRKIWVTGCKLIASTCARCSCNVTHDSGDICLRTDIATEKEIKVALQPSRHEIGCSYCFSCPPASLCSFAQLKHFQPSQTFTHSAFGKKNPTTSPSQDSLNMCCTDTQMYHNLKGNERNTTPKKYKREKNSPRDKKKSERCICA